MTSISSTTVASASPGAKGTVDVAIKSMIDALNDDTGAVSASQKAAVLDGIRQSRPNLMSSSQATKDYYNAGMSSSSFLKRGQALSSSLHAQLSARPVDQVRKGSDTFKLQLDFFNGLSEDDKLAFATLKGQAPEDWQANMEARLKLASRIEAAQASGELGLDGKPTGTASAALSLLIEASDNFDKLDKTNKSALNAWTRSVDELADRSDRPPAVRIDLSEDAKAYLQRQ